MNCDSAEVVCKCGGLFVSLHDIIQWAGDDGLEPYSPYGMCDGCVFFSSVYCDPLRQWAKNWVYLESNGYYQLPGLSQDPSEAAKEHKIERCNLYQPE